MNSNYQIWDWEDVRNACELDQLVGVDNAYLLSTGVSMLQDWPADAGFHMNPDFPHDTLLVDNVRNIEDEIVVSERLKVFLEANALANIEYLPVSVFDHKGKLVVGRYFLVHPLDPVDCLDLDACEIKWSKIDPDEVMRMKRLVIKTPDLDPRRLLFRIQRLAGTILVHRDLANAISSEKITGVKWKELENYSGS